MTIDPINPPKKVYSSQKGSPLRPTKSPSRADEVSISTEAKQEAFLKKVQDAIRTSPDIRTDKVEQAKKNLAKYIDAEGQIRPDVLKKMTTMFMESHPPTG